MSIIQERQFFLQLWRFVTGPAIDVMQLYFEVKVLNNTKFEKFLNDPLNKHILFHQCFPKIPCCQCAKSSLASSGKKGCLILQQFDQLYDNSGVPKLNHENMTGSKILQHCLCKFSAKCSVTVDEIDITLFYNVVQHCCPSKMKLVWRINIKDVRNFLAHVANGQVKKADFEDKWKTLTDATLGFAGEISNKCKKMTQEVILEIENSSIEALKEKLKKSNEDLIKKLDALNGIKQTTGTVDEWKNSVELIKSKQDENFNKLQSSFGKSDEILKETKQNKTEMCKLASDIQEVKYKVDNLESIIKVDNLESVISIAIEKAMKKSEGKTSADDRRQITVATQVDSSSWDEENTIRNISNKAISEIDKRSCDTEKFHITNVEHKCIQLELVAFPDVFKSQLNLRKALRSLVDQLVEAGEIDTNIPDKLKINITVKSSLTREEIAVVHSVFDDSVTLEDQERGITIKTNLQDGISRTEPLKLDPDNMDKFDIKQDMVDTENSMLVKMVKMEITDEAKFEKISVDVGNIKCLLKLKGLPDDLRHSDKEESYHDLLQDDFDDENFPVLKVNEVLNVVWTINCLKEWDIASIASSINDNVSVFNGEFPIGYAYTDTNNKLILQTTTQRHVFRSSSLFDLAVQRLICKIVELCSLKSNEPEELFAEVLIISKTGEEEICEMDCYEEVRKDQTNVSKYDNYVICQQCKNGFSCDKCSSKIKCIGTLNKTLQMKEITIQKLENVLTKIEQGLTTEPIPRKRKRTITSDEEMSKGNTLYSKDAIIPVDTKKALQKLGEILLVDYQIEKCNTRMADIHRKWFHQDNCIFFKLKRKEWKATLNILQWEKEQRTDMIEELTDIIYNKEDICADKAYDTDIGFLDFEVDTSIQCDYCHTEMESQIPCYCKDCDVFFCDGCVPVKRAFNNEHKYWYRRNMLRGYELKHSWGYEMDDIIDVKCLNPNTIVLLKSSTFKLCILTVYNITGTLLKSHIIQSEKDKCKIACINDSRLAITIPKSHCILIVTVIPTFETNTILTIPELTMTGGITCKMNTLYIAYTDAIRLIDLSGNLLRTILVPGVNILHYNSMNKIWCVYSKSNLKKTVSWLDCTSDAVSDCVKFPFHPVDITSDNDGNLIFSADGVIWQADSHGNNFKVMISPPKVNTHFMELSYDKQSNTLVSLHTWENKVQVYSKLE